MDCSFLLEAHTLSSVLLDFDSFNTREVIDSGFIGALS